MAILPKSCEAMRGFTCYWRIEDFTWRPFSHQYSFDLESPIFKIPSPQSEWQIVIQELDEHLGAFISTVSSQVSTCFNISLSVLTEKGWKEIYSESRKQFLADGRGWGNLLNGTGIGCGIYMPKGSLDIIYQMCNEEIESEITMCVMTSKLISNYTPKGVPDFTLQHKSIKTFSTLPEIENEHPFPHTFEFWVSKEKKDVKTQIIQTDTEVNFEDTNDLMNLFKEKQFSFVTLQAENKEFFVHKAILCAKSPVFKAMFEKNMLGNDKNLVSIEDISSKAMTLFLKFLHFESVRDVSWESVVKLLYAADKFQTDDLKRSCISFIKKELSTENVCDVFILAERHQNKDLMSCALEYFCKNSKFVLPSEKWKDLVISNPVLITKVLCKLSENM